MTLPLVKLMSNPVPISYVVTLHSRRPPTAKLSIMPLQKKTLFMVALVTLCYHCMAIISYACKSKVIRLEMNPCPSISKMNLQIVINIQLCKRDPVAQLVGARNIIGVEIIMVSTVNSTQRVNLKAKKKIKKQQRRKRQKKRQLKRRRRQKQRLLQTRKQPKLIAVTKKKKL